MNIIKQGNDITRTVTITLIMMALVGVLIWLNAVHGETTASSDGASDQSPEGRATAQQDYRSPDIANRVHGIPLG